MYERKSSIPVDALLVASRLIGDYGNLGLTSNRASKRIAPIKDSLERSLKSLARQINYLDDLDGKRRREVELARFRCDDLLARYARTMHTHWDEAYIRRSAQDVTAHALYQHVVTKGGRDAAALFPTGKTQDEKVDAVVMRYLLARRLFLFAAEATGLSARPGRENIIRAIQFPPEYKQAGISILNYFSEILDRRYPGHDVGVRIEQSGSKVTLIIEAPSGELERFEEELSKFGLAVTGQMPLETYSSDPAELMLLKTKLEIAALEVRQVTQLLQVERSHYGARIEALESNLEFMRNAFERTSTDTSKLVDTIRGIAAKGNEATASALERVLTLLQSESPEVESLVDELVTLRSEAPSVLSTLNELFIKGSIQGAAGNYLYAALQALQRIV